MVSCVGRIDLGLGPPSRVLHYWADTPERPASRPPGLNPAMLAEQGTLDMRPVSGRGTKSCNELSHSVLPSSVIPTTHSEATAYRVQRIQLHLVTYPAADASRRCGRHCSASCATSQGCHWQIRQDLLFALYVYVVIRVIFFFAVNARNKKTVRSCIFFFFAVSCVSRLTRLTARKKKLHDLTVFLLRAFTTKKTLHDLPQKKRITRHDDFFVHAFTAKIRKLHDLTAKKQLPILLKMHACRRCAHLWPRSGR